MDLETKRKQDIARLEKYTKEKRGGKSFWDRFTVDLLERLWLRIDRANFIRYALLKGGTEWLNGNKDIPDRVRKAIRRGTGIWKRGDDGEFYKWMQWRLLGACADVFGVPMELLVDEDYYFSRWGLAGYRVLCEAHRKDMSMEELTYLAGISDNPRYAPVWYYTWYCFFIGKSTFFEGKFYPDFFSKVLVISNERLGVPIGALVGKQLHTAAKAVDIYGELSSTLTALGDRECAVVAAVAKALHDYKFSKQSGKEFLTGAVERLMGWYLNGEEEEKA